MNKEDSNEKLFLKKGKYISTRIVLISLIAIVTGFATGVIADGLVKLIGFITNLSFYGTISTKFTSPSGNHLGWWVVLIPALGGIIVGLMARYGSKAIRGHGLPEAMESVINHESRIAPNVAYLKPISSAIAIGTGGPFGAEGPIIATGAAFGSVIGQLFKITTEERKILLAAGAAAGMAAIFGSPVAGVLMAIELLLFEFSARSIIPVALACVAGDIMHIYFMGSGAIFAMPTVALPSTTAMLIYVIIGLIVGVLAVISTKMMYYFEDLFSKIPVHWMWYPAIGGLAVGFIGYYFPNTLGVGYDNIRDVLSGSVTLQTLIALCLFKLISWTIALSSDTSGGTLAPLFIIGGATGALLGTAIIFLFPQIGLDVRLAALVGMAAIFSGASRALFTSIVFAVEATLQPNALLPLLGACTAAYIVSYLLMETTIMTEKVERRGVKVPTVYEYSFLVLLNVQKVMKKNCITFSSNNTLLEVREIIKRDRLHEIQTAFPVVDDNQKPIGIVTLQQIKNTSLTDDNSIQKIIQQKNIFITEDVFLQDAINLMAENNAEILPVVSDKKLVGIITYKSLMDAYALNLKEKFDRKKMLHFWKQKAKN